jgi:hypothetical protein
MNRSICAILLAAMLSLAAAAQQAPQTPQKLELPGLPSGQSWRHTPVSAEAKDGVLTIAAGANTNWLISPFDGATDDNAPTLLVPVQGDFVLSAKITHDFDSLWDAGALVLFANDTTWAKFCFEKSDRGNPTVVSLVTRGLSDDSTAYAVQGHSIYFKIAKVGKVFFFYASGDGRKWTTIRLFTLNEGKDYKPGELRVGFLAQSPRGKGASVRFERIQFTPHQIADMWSGE